MKEWTTPTVEELNVKETASGGDPSTTEQNGGFSYGCWHNATYDSIHYNKCDGQGTVYKKDITES